MVSYLILMLLSLTVFIFLFSIYWTQSPLIWGQGVLWSPQKEQVNYPQMAQISTRANGVICALLVFSQLHRPIAKCICNCFWTDCYEAEKSRRVHLLVKKEMIWPQKKTGSEKNLKLIRISSSRWRPFQKMCMFTLQGMTGLAVYHFLLNRTLIWGDGKVARAFSLTQGWVLAMRLSLDQWKALAGQLGFWESSLKADTLLLPSGLPFLPSRKVGVTLQVVHSPCKHKATQAREYRQSWKAEEWWYQPWTPRWKKTHTQFIETTVYSSISLCTVEKKNLNR